MVGQYLLILFNPCGLVLFQIANACRTATVEREPCPARAPELVPENTAKWVSSSRDYH